MIFSMVLKSLGATVMAETAVPKESELSLTAITP